MQLLITFLFIVFALSAIVLVTVVLLQEGKGGGFGDAFGGAGQQTFGVGASGINKFTAVTAGVFLATALTITLLNKAESGGSVISEPGISVPADPFGTGNSTGVNTPTGGGAGGGGAAGGGAAGGGAAGGGAAGGGQPEGK
jgi:protein translocase SecG subunit